MSDVMPTLPAQTRSPYPPWWTWPHRFMAFIILPFAVLICVLTPELIASNGAEYDAPLFLTPFYVALFLSGVVLVGAGAYVGERTGPLPQDVRFRNGCLDLLFWLCMAAYIVWFGPLLLSSPDLVLGALKAEPGATYEIREHAPTLSGVTTASQFGISYCCIYSAKRFVFVERMPRRYLIFFATIIVVAALRAAAYSERIAFVEVVFPTVVMLCRGDRLTKAPPLRLFRATFPLLVLIGSPLYFTLFEYNRSWVIHYQYLYDSLLSFGLERMAIYFVTSLNNICGYLDHVAWPLYSGEATFNWLYRFPLVGDLLAAVVDPQFANGFLKFLDGYGIGEFNNLTGVLIAHHDWGLIGGSLFLLSYGVFAGRAFNSFRQSRGFLQYFYPVVLYSLFEILRIGYLFEGRAFAALIGLAIAYVGWRQTPAVQPDSNPVEPHVRGSPSTSAMGPRTSTSTRR